MESISEDDPQLLRTGFQPEALDAAMANGAVPPTSLPETSTNFMEAEDAGDVSPASVEQPPPPLTASAGEHATHRRLEFSTRHVVAELKQVEDEVRKILEPRDSKRKRRMAGTQRWLELEDDILSWKFAGRFDEATLRRLHQLVTRRHHLFRQLHFIAGTRPTWNT